MDEGARYRGWQSMDNQSGRAHSPASVIGRSEGKNERARFRGWQSMDKQSGPHTPPLRFSAGCGERVI